MRTTRTVAVSILLLLASTYLASQNLSIPIRISDNGGHFDTLWFGQDPGATYCVDPVLGESELPPKPPSGYFDVRWVEARAGSTCFGTGMKRDFRPGDDVLRLEYQAGYGGYPITLSWGDLSSLTTKTITLADPFGGILVYVDMKAQTSLVVTNTILSQLILTVGTPPPPAPQSPSASTGQTYSYDQTSAALTSMVNPHSIMTDCWFEWGTTVDYGQSTPSQSVGAGDQFESFSQSISGLLPQTVYHYRVVAHSSIGTTYGNDVPFTTIPSGTIGERLIPITVTDHGARSRTLWLGVVDGATDCIDAAFGEVELPPAPPYGIFEARLVGTVQFSDCFGTGLSADFRGYVDPDHGDLYKIVVQPGANGDPITLSWPDLGAWYAGTITLRDAVDGSIVNVDMKAQNWYTVSNPALRSFYIVSGQPAAQTPAAPFAITFGTELTTQSSGLLTGSAVPAGDSTSVWFEWGHTEEYGNATPPQSIGDGASYVSVSAAITSLYPRMVYHYRLVAQNSLGTTYGTDQSFMTIIEGIVGQTLFSLDVADDDLRHKLLWLGVAPDGTPCIDDYLGEVELPPMPPYGVFDARAVGTGGASCLGQGLSQDFRDQQSATQIDTFVVAFQSGSSGYPIDFTWDDLSGWFSGAVRMTDPFGGLVVDVDMTAQTFYSLTDNRIRSLLIVTGPAASVPALPSVITGAVGFVAPTVATLSGEINPNGFETMAWFEYGTSVEYGSATSPQSAGNGSEVVQLLQLAGGLSAGTLYHCRVVAENGNGTRYGPDVAFTTDAVTAVDDPHRIPERIALRQNYPNPFNPTTVIDYDLPEGGRVTIRIFNVFGQEVRTLVNQELRPGMGSVTFDATGLPSGVYYCRMTAGTFVGNVKLSLIR